VILGHNRRRIVHVAVAEHPTAAWTAQQLRNVFRSMARRDISCTIVIQSLPTWRPPSPALNMQTVRTAPRSLAERLLGTGHRLDPT
jgi:hypothetical protein